MNLEPHSSLGPVTVLCSAVHLKLGKDYGRIRSLSIDIRWWAYYSCADIFPERSACLLASWAERTSQVYCTQVTDYWLTDSLCLFNDTTKEWTRAGVTLTGMVRGTVGYGDVSIDLIRLRPVFIHPPIAPTHPTSLDRYSSSLEP